MTRRAQLDRFIAWLLGSAPQGQNALTRRQFRREHGWCWRVEPSIPITGEVFTQVQLDGFYLRSGWCCLIAVANGRPIAWQWCDTEKTVAWTALLERIPPPDVVVCDGGQGLASALKQIWPDTLIQRCLVHVQRDVRVQLTRKPRTEAGRALWGLTRTLTRINTRDEAVEWLRLLNDWGATYGHLTREKTYRSASSVAPAWIKPTRTWWWTHERLRRAWRLLERLANRGHLFTYLTVEDVVLDATTNMIEGGINAMIRDLLRRHRGMTPDHQRRAIEWWLQQHSDRPEPASSFIRPEHHQPVATTPTTFDHEPIGPARYDTGLSADEGLWTRQGRAGRT